MEKLTDTTPDPITTAREALDKLNKHVKPELNSPNCDRFNQIYAAFDYAEKLKAERDEAQAELALRRPSDKDVAQTHEARSQYRVKLKEPYGNADALPMEIRRLTSQLDQAEKVIAPFATQNNDDLKFYESDVPLRKLTTFIDLTVADLRAASQWIKDRQAKTDGEAS